eukprot:scaffold29446_cov143-Skeletonema_menzelii.AAC.3
MRKMMGHCARFGRRFRSKTGRRQFPPGNDSTLESRRFRSLSPIFSKRGQHSHRLFERFLIHNLCCIDATDGSIVANLIE